MDMVGHQAICIQFALKFVFPFVKVIKVIQIVVVRHENRLAVMSAMNNMVGMIRDYESCGSWHRQALPDNTLMNNEIK